MAGYLTTSGSWTVSDVGPSSYPHTVTATLTVTAGTGSSCDWKVAVSRPNWNFYQIYLKIDDTVLLNTYIQGNSKTYNHSGTATISGDDISITLGIATSQNSTSSSRMTYIYKTLTRKKWATVTNGKVTVKDNFNNSYTITAESGDPGTNNAVVESILSYPNSTGQTVSFDITNTTYGPKTIIFTPTTANKTKEVSASVRTVGEYNTVSTAHHKGIRQYVGPEKPAGHKLTYKKSRLTLKENWTISWTAPSINNECPIKGYRIRLYRKRGTGSWIKLPIYDSNGSMGHVVGDTTKSPTDYYWDRDGTSTSATIYTEYYNTDVIPNYPDILPGDLIKFSVTAYTKYGENYTGNKVFKTSEATSGEYTIQNAGIARVKVNGEWKEGQVYVKANGSWHEAETVNIKTSSGWQESQ